MNKRDAIERCAAFISGRVDNAIAIRSKEKSYTTDGDIRELLTESFSDIPDRAVDFVKYLKKGWQIVRCSCSCGGKFAWLDSNSRMFGCCCHNDPKDWQG